MRIKVYQVENDLDSKGVKFCSYDSAMKLASVIDPSIYECVFDGNIDAKNLEDVFEALNCEHPIGYRGHSLSVSDVVEVLENTDAVDVGCYYCDSIGFKELSDFDTSKIEPIKGCRMLVIEPHKAPYEMLIPDELDTLQQAVRGMIECTYPFDDNAFVIGNEEAKLIGMEGNRRILGEIYAGPILIAADDGHGGTKDLTDEQIEKYTKMFEQPEDISPDEVTGSIGFTIYGFG